MLSYGFGFFVFQVGLSSISPPYQLHVLCLWQSKVKLMLNETRMNVIEKREQWKFTYIAEPR